ncbi:MAG: class I SAM-dependent DNA methyltransferase [Thermoplasmata archaeon]
MGAYDRWACYYDLIYGDEMDYEAQCSALRSIFRDSGVPHGGRVLDLGCGTGGHAIPLARMAYQVTGIDNSRPVVEIAAKKAGSLPARFLHQDMRDLHLPGGFDAAICMFGGFGHITEIADVRRALRGISSQLISGGPFIFEYWSLGGVKPEHTSTEEVEREGRKVIRHARSSFNPATSILDIAFRFKVKRGDQVPEEFHVESPIRIYETGEMESLLADADFEVKTNYDGDGLYKKDVVTRLLRPMRENTFRVLCVALKR